MSSRGLSRAVYDRFVRSVVFMALGVLAGCSSPPPPVALGEFSLAARTALCDWAVRCSHVPDTEVCERFIDPKDYDTRRAEDAVAAGRLGWDAAAAGRCVAATRDAHCMAVPFSDSSCKEYLIGRVAEGGACTSDYECEGGAPCESAVCDTQCCVGVCGAPPTVTVEPPLLHEIGESCTTHFDCVVEAYCDEDGVCAPMPEEEGEHCLFGCAPGDLYCDVDALECRAYAPLGEACDADGVTAPLCNRTYSFCDGVCALRPDVGEPCDEEQRRCIPPLFCGAGGTCERRQAAGASCDDSSQCLDVCDPALGECVLYETCTAD